MHELAITTSILDIALRHAGAAARVTDVYLVIGELSSMIDDSVQFYWDIISQNTIAEGARLHFRRVAAELTCDLCGRRYGLREQPDLACPDCGSTRISVLCGEEFFLESIEIEEHQEEQPHDDPSPRA